MVKHSEITFFQVQWLDYMATIRTRIFPQLEFIRLIHQQQRFGIARGNTGTLQNDNLTSAVNAQGLLMVEPDLSTLRPTHSKDPLSGALVTASFREENGEPSPACPRSNLERLTERFESDQGINFLAGFEIELVFLKRKTTETDAYEPSDTNHAWCTLTPEQATKTMPLLAEIVLELAKMDIHVQQFHSESGPGQYEIVLPPLPLVAAIDALIQARQVVFQISHAHNYRATLHPIPLNGIGSGQHAHISLSSSTLSEEELEQKELSFFASVLEHLPSICAFSLPNEISYERVKDDTWSGGTWCCWGTQNRETPLRRVTQGRWELRCLDGFANPYLALGAVLAAGLEGVEKAVKMKMADCRDNPARLDDARRRTMGIVKKIPSKLDDALAALEGDAVLEKLLGSTLVGDFIAMKRAEKDMLGKMPRNSRKAWLIERY